MSIVAAALAVTPLLTGCSSFSSSSANPPSANQTVAMPPPPNTAAPGSAAAAPAYPPPQAQQQANAGNSNGFLNMFRDTPLQENDARASGYPQQSLSDLFKGSTDQSLTPDPSGAGYPLQPLISSSSAQQANMPHPPPTYTPSGQPYVPPPNQTAYTPPQPPPAQPPAAAPAPEPANAAPSSGAYPQQSLSDLFKNRGQ